MVFLKKVPSVHDFVAHDAVEVCFFVLFYCLTELLPMQIVLLQLRVSRSKLRASRSSSQLSPSINSLDVPSPVYVESLLD